jgi:hypothetical protein
MAIQSRYQLRVWVRIAGCGVAHMMVATQGRRRTFKKSRPRRNTSVGLRKGVTDCGTSKRELIAPFYCATFLPQFETHLHRNTLEIFRISQNRSVTGRRVSANVTNCLDFTAEAEGNDMTLFDLLQQVAAHQSTRPVPETFGHSSLDLSTWAL